MINDKIVNPMYTQKNILKICFVALITLNIYTGISAQSPQALFSSVKTAIEQKNATGLISNCQNNVEITVPGSETKLYSHTQAKFVLDAFFKKYSGQLTVLHEGQSGNTHYQTGTYAGLDVSIFAKKVGDKFSVTQIRFEEE